MRAASGLAPRERVQPVLHAEAEEPVPGGMELDLVDPLAEAVVRPQDRRVLVGEPSQLERLAAAEAAERRAALFRGAAALAPERLHEGLVLREQVVALERRRLVCCAEAGRGHQIVLNCSNGWRQALQ